MKSRADLLLTSLAVLLLALFMAKPLLYHIAPITWAAWGLSPLLFAAVLHCRRLSRTDLVVVLLFSAGVAVTAALQHTWPRIYPVALGGFALAFLMRDRMIPLWLSRGTFLLVSLIILVKLLGFQIHPNHVFVVGSQNYISIMATFLFAFLMLNEFLHRRPIPFWPSLLLLVLSLLGVGRTGIATALMMGAALALYRLWPLVGERFKRKSFLLLLGLGFLALATLSLVLIIPHTRFAVHGIDSPRWLIWAEFFRALSLPHMILGIDLKSVEFIGRYFKGNVHNSFLDYWAQAGIFFFPVMTMILVSLVNWWKTHRFLAFVFFMLLFTAFFNVVLFFRVLDFVFLSFFVLGLLPQRSPL